MELSDDLKPHWANPTSFSKPLNLHHPLSSSYTPSPKTLTHLLTLSLSPILPPPFPQLSLSSFLSLSSIPPSLSPSLSSTSLPNPSLFNTFRMLRLPGSDSVLLLFPVGENWDRVGFVRIVVGDGKKVGVGDGGKVRVSATVDKMCGQRIVKLFIRPFKGKSSIGFLMACTMYGVQWYSVEIDKKENPKLDFIGCKVFKSCGVVDACWNPHVPEESLVILESGKLVLFDMNAFSSGRRLKVSWKDWPNLGKGEWLGCEFGWHPEILVVAHSSAVFLLDFRESGCVLTCLLEIDTSVIHTPTHSDRFFAFSKASSEYHQFVIASEHRIVLFDVRKALVPLLQWSHNIPNPCYIDVFPLSQLRVYPKDDGGSKGFCELGKCIVLGSFWNSEFNLFCYGPLQATKSAASKISKYDSKLCALDIPSELSLSGRECSCGSCLVREEFWKDSLPPWIDWRQKKEIVLGFGIIDKELDTKLSEQGGFTVIRLMSSGKIESQRYIPSHDSVETGKKPLEKSVCDFQDSLLFNDSELEYKFRKRFQYQKVDYLCAYMKDDLDKVLFEKVKGSHKVQCTRDYISSVDFHQSVCEKLKTFGFNRSSNVVSNVLKGTRGMSSVHEVALSKIWTHFPSDLLQLAFCYYSQLLEVLLDNKKVSLEFLDIPNQPQYPPFVFREPSRRSSKWSRKVRPSTGFVGPVLPTPVLLTIHELRKEEASEFSANSEMKKHCNEVIEVVNDTVFHGGAAVSLGDDKDVSFDDIENMNRISLLKVVPKTYGSSTEDAMSEDHVSYDEKFTTFICKKSEKEVSKTDGPEMFDSLSPIELKFDGPVKLGTNTDTFRYLKLRYSSFLKNYDPYQQYLEKNNLR